MSTPSMDRLRRFLRSEAVMPYLDEPNISSVGIGFKTTAGKADEDQIAIQFTVDRKLAGAALNAAEMPEIPASFTVDGAEVPTDVVERRYGPTYRLLPQATAPDARKVRVNPVMPGVSISNIHGTAGTLGAVVYDADTGRPCLLSNWHVLHGPNGTIGDWVVQPGPHDDNGVYRNTVGRLMRSHLGLAGDCALSSLQGRAYLRQVYELNVPTRRMGDVELGDRVVKSGRTTGVTHGRVQRVDVTGGIPYGGTVGTVKIGGFEIGPDPEAPPPRGEVSMGGDSGSMWMAMDPDTGGPTDVVVGVLYAGDRPGTVRSEYVLACPIRTVARKLRFTLQPTRVG